MCNAFANLSDDLDSADIFSDMDREKPEPGAPLREIPTAAIEALHYDTCKACNGSKVFRSYTGRVVGQCFKCKGEGKIGYKQSPEKRAAARNAKANKKQAQIETWKAEHQPEFDWLLAAMGRGFQIAANLFVDLTQYGSLTEGKVNLIRRFMAEDIQRAEAKAKSIETAKVIDLAKIMAAFENAAANQVKAPMLRLDRYRFITGNTSLLDDLRAIQEGSLPPTLTLEDIRADLQLSRMSIWRLRKEGDFPPVMMIGKSPRYDRTEYVRWKLARHAA